jgi:hypothetical protein
MSKFHQGMHLSEAAERIGPIVGMPPEQIAGFVIVVVDTEPEPGTGPVIAASENIPPAIAADLMILAGEMLAANLAADAARRGCN